MKLGRSGGAVLLLTASCMLNGPSRVGQGQLYTSGNPTYDAYFRDVHQQQVDAASWGDDKKGAHRALVASLELTPDAPDVTIVQATHEASSKVAKQAGSVRLDVEGTAAHIVASGGAGDAGPLFRAVEDTAHQELERARRLHAVEPKLDALVKLGNDLEGRVRTDFIKYGETKENEVATEVMASLDVVSKLKSHAGSEARESEDFVADLERALETASEEKAKMVATKRPKKKHDEASTKSASASSDPPPVAAKPAPPPPAAPAAKPPPPPPKPADTGEVFTP